ncbi:phage tail spike protein [Glutamicibacter arilaitensis]|uniref:phage tail spike protein n=1 Tax=Glutamicibacter arilaitensis TaxID=256701 RepID=UPI003FD6BD06
MWDDRFSFSGEIPLNYPALNPVALQRITPATGAFYSDTVTPSREWERITGGANDGYVAGSWGYQMGLNSVNPATDQGGFELPYFAGLWPSSGKLLIGLWSDNNYSMTFCPLMSTRGGTSPVVYLSTSNTGQIRHGVYNASGGLVLDSYEQHPWRATSSYQFIGMLVDFDGLTSQMFSVDVVSKQHWLGPVRTLSGPPNAASTANLDIYRLQNSGYWTSGAFDEALVAHPGAGFDLNAFAENMALGQWSNAQAASVASSFAVTDSEVTALASATLKTGAEIVSWAYRPFVQGVPSGGVPYWSTDSGATWQTGAELPETLDGLLRWEIPMTGGDTFTGATLTEPNGPAPTIAPIADMAIQQGELVNVNLSYTISDLPGVWSVVAPQNATVSITDGVMSVSSGFRVGTGAVTVTLTDALGRSASQTFLVETTPREWVGEEPPEYPHAPIVVWGEALPQAVIIDPLEAFVTREVNGEHKLEILLPSTHKHAELILNERRLTLANETYWIRRIETSRKGRRVVMQVYAEAGFYDLATAGQIDAREWQQVTAGDVMTEAVKGTGWKVGIANVSTLRTYSTENTNPLALLQTVQENHGGDLLFDNNAKTVSLVTDSGRKNGVSFFYGRGLTESRRVVDTTSLFTRIYPRNADGQTIASVNNGIPYVENFEYTSEIKETTYDFKAGTSPYTMLAMANATIAARSKPSYSYEVTVSDMSALNGASFERFDAGDYVTVVDQEVGIAGTQRIVKLEYNVVRPWKSKVTLSAKLRELGSSDSTDSGLLDTGSGVSTFDLVPFNLLLNSRFDNDLAHWANLGAQVVPGNGTGDYAVQFSGAGERWIEQTVIPDNRDAYAFSFDLESSGPTGFVPNVTATAEITYEDGSTEIIELDLS